MNSFTNITYNTVTSLRVVICVFQMLSSFVIWLSTEGKYIFALVQSLASVVINSDI